MTSRTYDVIVAGGGSAGIGAALGARRAGARTLLIERGPCLGGAATLRNVVTYCGLYTLDERQVVFGVAEEMLAPSRGTGEEGARVRAARDGLRALFDETSSSLERDAEAQVVRWKLLTSTPSLFAAYLGVMSGFEELVRSFLADRANADLGADDAHLVAAMTVTAFRVAAQTWTGRNGSGSLRELAQANLTCALAHWA